MNSRNVIIFANHQMQAELAEGLSKLDWQILPINNINETSPTALNKTVHVGLYHIQDASEQELDKLDELINCSHCALEWIALVSAEDLQSSRISRIVKAHFFDFHTLPLNFEHLRMSIGHAHGKGQLSNQKLTSEITENFGMVGKSPVMQNLYRNLCKASKVEAPVLISGESGTGKELAAKAIHHMSARANKPFVAVNCGALPANLIQTELFGHEKGAFTGAHQSKIGRMEAASGGTIFLDEIGDLPLDLQVNLLHVLQDKVIERVGSIRKIQLDVRVIAATHVNLELAVKEGRFREDLYYRLNVVHLEVPPLRAREDDVESLANAYLEKFLKEAKSKVTGFSLKALQAMRCYYWPGNVRQLVNRIWHAVVMSENHLITPEDLGIKIRSMDHQQAMTLDMARAQAERDAIRSSLSRNRNNASEAARQLGISRATLYRLLERHDKLLLNLIKLEPEQVIDLAEIRQQHQYGKVINGSKKLEALD